MHPLVNRTSFGPEYPVRDRTSRVIFIASCTEAVEGSVGQVPGGKVTSGGKVDRMYM